MAELSSEIKVKVEMDEDLKLAIETFEKRIKELEQKVFRLEGKLMSC